MSRGIVSHKPYFHKKRKQSLTKILNRSGIQVPEIKISEKLKSIISRGLCYIIIIVCGIIFLVKALFFGQEQKISHIKISDNTLATYQDIELFNMILDEVRGKNYFLINSNKEKILTKIQSEFPFVGAIQFQLESQDYINNTQTQNNRISIGINLPDTLPITGTQIINADFPLKKAQEEIDNGGTLGVQIQYYEPKLIVKLNEKKFAIRDENSYVEIQEGTLLGTNEDGTELFTIETPQYLSGTSKLNGFFFEFKLKDFLTLIPLAEKDFPTMKRFVYLAGSRRIIIFTHDDKMLFFNFPEGCDLEEQRKIQINKYNLLKEKYDGFNSIQNIDLGALENNKVIFRK